MKTSTTRGAGRADPSSSPCCGTVHGCTSAWGRWWTLQASVRHSTYSSAPRRRGSRSRTTCRNSTNTRHDRRPGEVSASLKSVGAITLFVEDSQRSKSFYRDVFDLSVIWEDEDSTAFRFENVIV